MNWTGKIATLFVKNQRLSLLLLIALFVWGTIFFFATPKQYNPKITAPAFQIRVDFPGASRKEVLEQVTKPLENIVADIPQVEDIYSVTMAGGVSIVNVNFFVGEDVDSSKITLSDRIESRLDLAPLGIAAPHVQSIDPDDVPVMTIAITSDVTGPVKLRKFAFSLRDRLTDIPGASNLHVIGGRRNELAIDINPYKLITTDVGITDIENALRRENLYLPSGVIKTRDRFIPVETTSIVSSPEDLKNIVVRTSDYGQVFLKDIAIVESRVEEIEEYVRHQKKTSSGVIKAENVVLISVAKQQGTNISTVTDSIKAKLRELNKTFVPKNIKVDVIVNEGDVAYTEIKSLVINLFTAILIVAIILFLFLDTRAAFLVAISIPLTLFSVFGVAKIAGQNINRITLFALILSLGLLVDSATVVIENIVRKLKDAKKNQKNKIIIESVNEVGKGLFMSTVTTVLAFIPMLFVTGMMGPYMGPIPFFLPAALILALFISYSINPWMASVFINTDKTARQVSLPEKVRTILDQLKSIGSKIFELYHTYLHSLLVNRKKRRWNLMAVGILLLISLTLPALQLVKFRMLPKDNRKQFFVYIDLPTGTSLSRTLQVTKHIENLLISEKEITMTQSYIGRAPVLDFNGLFRNASARTGSHQATIRAGLSSPSQRDKTSVEIVKLVRPKISHYTNSIPKIKPINIKLVEDPPGPPVLSTFLVRIQGYDKKLLEQTAKDLYEKTGFGQIKGLVDTDTSIPEKTTTVTLKVNHKQASIRRISPARVVRTLNTVYSGKILGIYHNQANIEQEYITLRLDRKFRISKSSLDKLVLFNDLGNRIALSSIVSIVDLPTVKPVLRENRISTIYLYGDMSGRSVTYAAIDMLSFLYSYKLADGKGTMNTFSLFKADFTSSTGKPVSISLGGEWELTLEVFRDLGIAMGVAVFLIYFVLVIQFGSFREPLIIMSTIPLSLIGVMPGFMILGFTIGLYFNATSMIGVIALAGIAVNNSIILLEYLNSLKKEGIGIEDALIKAGTTRFRPIMLTTITTILGSLTIASDPVWAGLAWAIVFGLGISSVLTLFVFPVMYFNIKGKEWQS